MSPWKRTSFVHSEKGEYVARGRRISVSDICNMVLVGLKGVVPAAISLASRTRCCVGVRRFGFILLFTIVEIFVRLDGRFHNGSERKFRGLEAAFRCMAVRSESAALPD